MGIILLLHAFETTKLELVSFDLAVHRNARVMRVLCGNENAGFEVA